jgi:hypothetical protein
VDSGRASRAQVSLVPALDAALVALVLDLVEDIRVRDRLLRGGGGGIYLGRRDHFLLARGAIHLLRDVGCGESSKRLLISYFLGRMLNGDPACWKLKLL